MIIIVLFTQGGDMASQEEKTDQRERSVRVKQDALDREERREP